jgi:hypothetical protein
MSQTDQGQYQYVVAYPPPRKGKATRVDEMTPSEFRQQVTWAVFGANVLFSLIVGLLLAALQIMRM